MALAFLAVVVFAFGKFMPVEIAIGIGIGWFVIACGFAVWLGARVTRRLLNFWMQSEEGQTDPNRFENFVIAGVCALAGAVTIVATMFVALLVIGWDVWFFEWMHGEIAP
jgi:hypothetical protein